MAGVDEATQIGLEPSERIQATFFELLHRNGYQSEKISTRTTDQSEKTSPWSSDQEEAGSEKFAAHIWKRWHALSGAGREPLPRERNLLQELLAEGYTADQIISPISCPSWYSCPPSGPWGA